MPDARLAYGLAGRPDGSGGIGALTQKGAFIDDFFYEVELNSPVTLERNVLYFVALKVAKNPSDGTTWQTDWYGGSAPQVSTMAMTWSKDTAAPNTAWNAMPANATNWVSEFGGFWLNPPSTSATGAFWFQIYGQ